MVDFKSWKKTMRLLCSANMFLPHELKMGLEQEADEGLAGLFEEVGEIEPHEAYVSILKARHGRKYSFWGPVK